MPTICFACERVSSRRLARPPRRPISARYSRTLLSAQFAAVVRAFFCPQFFGERFFRVGFADRSRGFDTESVLRRITGQRPFGGAAKRDRPAAYAPQSYPKMSSTSI